MPLKEQVGRGEGLGRSMKMGDEQYLWLLVLLEVGVLAWGRFATRRLHGG